MSLPADYQPPSFEATASAPKDASQTPHYGMSHTMFRIKDPRVSLPFYIETLVFAAANQIPSDAEEKKEWLWNQSGVLELCHNWGTENDANFKHCSGNEAEHKGFGHICILVDDLQRACDRFTSLGVKFKKRPEEGSMRHIAFILDPDGYWVEVITRGGQKK